LNTLTSSTKQVFKAITIYPPETKAEKFKSAANGLYHKFEEASDSVIY
jgi:hypothetical protein